jgi:uncharacterized membrane protein YebE (DUF533 family)
MNISELLGGLVQSGMSASSNDRMKNSLGGGVLDNLTSMLGGSSGPGGGSGGGGIGDLLSSVLGGGQKGGVAAGAGGGIGDLLSNMLGDAGKAVGGNKNLAIGGLGALIGSLLGGGGKSLGGAVGGGVMALLGMLAFNALKGSGQEQPPIPAGLLEPKTENEKKRLEQSSEIVLRAMINAIKADGRVDQNEVNRMMGKFSELGVDAEGQRHLMTQLQQSMETEKLIAAAKNQPDLAAQIYAASLLAIEVDTQAEKNYLDQLAAGLGLAPQVTGRIQQMVGLQPA